MVFPLLPCVFLCPGRERLALKWGLQTLIVCQITLEFVCSPGLNSGVSDKAQPGHLQFSGGSDSGGARILTLRFSASEDRRESVHL